MATNSSNKKESSLAMPLSGPLKDFASVEQGFQFREMVRDDPSGEIKLIQIKNVLPDVPIRYETLIKIYLKKLKESQLVKNGDVLFISRAERKIAVALTKPPNNVTVGAQFFIIRVLDERLEPEYLAWYINQTPAQEYIEKHSKGSNVQIINKHDTLHLPVIVPPKEKQQLIVQVHKLREREARLVHEIEECRRQRAEAILLASIYQDLAR